MKKNLSLLFILIALAIVSGGVFYFSDTQELNNDVILSDFAIQDTSLIDRIFIADTDGNSVNLEREGDSYNWLLNGKYYAREDAINLILKTISRIEVKLPVPNTMKEGVIKMIAGRGIKVEIFTEGTHAKTYLVGSCTPEHLGTYMVLEMPDGSRSSDPVVVHMEGNRGCFRQRFFTEERDWRHTGIFNYKDLEFSKIEVVNHDTPEESFALSYNGGNNIKLQALLMDKDVSVFDTVAVKNYLLLYKKVHFETFNNHLSEKAQDSLLSTTPAYTIKVTENSGEVRKVNLFWKESIIRQLDDYGEVMKWDGDRMYGYTDENEIVFVQRFTFDPLIKSIYHFRPKK